MLFSRVQPLCTPRFRCLELCYQYDPKDLISYHADNQDVQRLVYYKRYTEAVKIAERMIGKFPKLYPGYYNIANIAYAQNNFREAADYLRKAIPLKPDNLTMLKMMAMSLVQIEKVDESMDYFNKALQMDPNSADTHQNFAIALIRKGDLQQAVLHFEKCLQLEPNSPDMYFNLGKLYSQQGDFEKAVKYWKRCLEFKPVPPQVLNNLAWVMATEQSVKNPDEALRFALRACELTGFEHPSFLDTLAVAYAATGKFDKAIETAQKALNIAYAANQPQMANDIQKRITLYKNKQSYTEPAKNEK